MKVFVGIDIGTTGIRAGVYGEEFGLLGTGTGKSEILKGRSGEITQDPEEMYRQSAYAVKAALREANVDRASIAGLSFDGQMAGIMGVDRAWRALTPYDSWLDTRCTPQVERMKERAGRLVVHKTGNIPSFNHGPKILWWKENMPEVFRKIACFIQPSAYVAGKLCGLGPKDAFIDWTYLHFSGFADNRALIWDDELCGLFDIPREKLPRIVSPFTVIGESSRKESDLFGIPPGVPVAAGCGDTASCFLGTGAVERGVAVDVAGTASVFALATEEFLTDRTGTVYTSRSVFPDLWYTMSYINGGGLNLEWFRQTFAPEKSFEALNELVEEIPTGSDGLLFIPHLEGRGYPYVPQMRGNWKGFTRNHTLAHFYRSVLEGVGYEYAIYRERIMEIRGGDLPFQVRGVGGGAASAAWNRIKADILGSDYCTINREDISTLGQALITAGATESIRDVRETTAKIIQIEQTFPTNRQNHRIYGALLKRYREMLSC